MTETIETYGEYQEAEGEEDNMEEENDVHYEAVTNIETTEDDLRKECEVKTVS